MPRIPGLLERIRGPLFTLKSYRKRRPRLFFTSGVILVTFVVVTVTVWVGADPFTGEPEEGSSLVLPFTEQVEGGRALATDSEFTTRNEFGDLVPVVPPGAIDLRDPDESTSPIPPGLDPQCDVALDGLAPEVVVSTLVPVVDESGFLFVNVRSCEAVDPLDPFAEFYSAYFECGSSDFQFGYETHAGVQTVLGNPTEAHTLGDGSFLFGTGFSPIESFASDVVCTFASWETQDGAVFSGETSIRLSSDGIETGDPARFFPDAFFKLEIH